MVKPWVDNGYRAVLLDIQHPQGIERHGAITTIGGDIRESIKYLDVFPKPDMIFCFPPCTHFAVSGARWWAGKGEEVLKEAKELVRACFDIIDMHSHTPYMFENPVGRLKDFIGKPTFYFHPNEYGGYLQPAGDFYTKKTGIWCSPNFVIPTKKPVFPFEGSKMHRIPPSPDRANLRSATPMGFARAVYEANHLTKL